MRKFTISINVEYEFGVAEYREQIVIPLEDEEAGEQGEPIGYAIAKAIRAVDRFLCHKDKVDLLEAINNDIELE